MPKAPSAARVPQLLSQIWHLPDTVHWMDPLPPFHRRGIILAIVIILMAFLWPSSMSQQTSTSIPTSNPAGANIPIQAELNNQQSVTAPARQSVQPHGPVDSAGQWRGYQIASGQTLAQLFRDNNLPVNDVFAMAQVEGDDKPLSHLQTGQAVKIRQNAQGVVTGLTIDSDNGQVLFTRQPDGSFLRVHQANLPYGTPLLDDKGK
ncbi:Opacity-associated protein A [Erwinia endophytica]|uniref:LysM-like peptidoglycan-binding domain-containing protein n=1 Tax=Erwinia endophytica TaxID=1563158 RepID=UPI001265E91E|nr:LysM-like peptidoglycan-binding domain-containing protein [Erwinia endophytica]KAB8311900.1 Opacity-associated protein A [Erwinia endophytica]